MDVTFAPSPHADVLKLVLQVALLLGVARTLGELARRFSQPAVVGEILAGVILGPSLLGALAPALAGVWLPASGAQAQLLDVVALIGVVLLMVVTGLQTDLALIRRRAGAAIGVAFGGFIVPFAAGLAMGWWFPSDLIGRPEDRLVFALFFATAMAVSAIPVLASMLLELRVMRRDIGQTMLAAGMVDDLAGWTVLGVVIALAEGGGGLWQLGKTILTVATFLAVTVIAGPFIVNRTVGFVHGLSGTPHRFLTATVVLVFGWGAFSQALHLEPIVGVFAMGVILGRVRGLPASVAESLESMAFGVFAPIFFAVVGLRVDVIALAEPRLAWLTLATILVAVTGKLAGAYAGGRWLAGADRWTSLSFGMGLTARGAIGIVVATVGRSLGIISGDVFSMVVVMAVATSLLTPPALKAALRRVPVGEDEAARIKREQSGTDASIARIGRVLIPLRPGEPTEGFEVKTELLRRVSVDSGLAVTFMSVTTPAEKAQAAAAIRTAAGVVAGFADVTERVALGEPVRAVLDEAAKGYDLVVLGAARVATDSVFLFDSVVDEIVRMVPVPTLIVRGGTVGEEWRLNQILLPTDGTAASLRAAELAFQFAGPDTTVTVLHVVSPDISPAVSVSETGPIQRLDLAHQILSEVGDRGLELGVATSTMVEMGRDVDEAIIAAARVLGADLVVLGSSVRAGKRRLYLGPRIERVLAACPCPVAVLNG